MIRFLVAPTLIALIVTDLISDVLTIDGIGTWVAATVIAGPHR